LSLIDGELPPDQNWMYALPIEIANASLFLWNDVPEITKVRFLLAKGSNADLQEADTLLKTLLAVARHARFKFHEYDILVLQAIYLNLSGKTKLALETLDACISEASSKGWVRPFVEPGPLILPLLDGLLMQEKHVKAIHKFKSHIDVMLFEVEAVASKPEKSEAMNSLTQRELETVKLVEQGLRNKEIADVMFVSVDAIKKNIYRIFQKLDVHSRVELVTKTKALGLTETAT
jgi:LuxR family maltose regulon positive regulatory protein